MPGITKTDIDDFRKLVDMHRQYEKITKRLGKKLGCDFYCLSDWAEKLGSQPGTTDADMIFAMGRLSLDDF